MENLIICKDAVDPSTGIKFDCSKAGSHIPGFARQDTKELRLQINHNLICILAILAVIAVMGLFITRYFSEHSPFYEEGYRNSGLRLQFYVCDIMYLIIGVILFSIICHHTIDERYAMLILSWMFTTTVMIVFLFSLTCLITYLPYSLLSS